MDRFFFTVLFCTIASCVYAQLPSGAGQVWREYPAFVESGPPGMEKGTYVPHRREFGPEVVHRIKKQTGVEAWQGPNMGLIGCDENKIYVYHTPEMQQKVNELVARFARLETQDVQFTAEVRFFTHADKPVHPNDVFDFRAHFFELLHPIVKEDKWPISKTPGIHAYWIAKEDIPKFEAAYAKGMGDVNGDSRSNILQAPKVTIFNGDRGQVSDVSQRPFVTDVIPIVGDFATAYHPVITIANEGQWLEVFSLLSYDRKTVTTDFSAAFTKIEKVGMAKVVEKEDDKNVDNGVTLQVPFQRKTEFAVDDITWPADGMLLLFVTGIERQVEGRKEMGVPILNKVPYINRRFTNTVIGRDVQTLNIVMTVKMLESE